MEQQQKQVSREAVADVGMESGQQHHQQEHHQQHQHHHQQQQSEWDSFGPDSCGSATLLGPFGAMAETLNAGTAEADKAGLDAVAKPRTTESPPASAAAAAAAATGYMEMGQMSDFEILAHEKGDESDVSPAGVRVELEMPKNWTSDFEAQKEVFYQDPSPSIFQDLSTGHGERFATAGLSEVDLNKAAGSPHSDEGQQIESCDSSPADDIVTVFPKPSALFTESSVASFQGRGSPEAVGSLSGKTSPSEDKTPKKATSPDKPMEKLIYLAQEKYLDTTVPQKRESDGEVLTKNPRKDERAEALKPRDAHVGEKQPVVYHPGYSEAETISISQESSPLEEISPISEEFTDKLIVASDEVQMRQPSTEMEYSISLSQESSPGEDSSPVTGNLGHVFPKPSAAATTVQQQQQQQLAGIDSSEEKQVPIAKKDNSLTSSYVSSSTEESSPGEEGVRVVGGGSKSGEKEDFVEEVAPLSHEEERSPRKTESRAGVDGKEPGFAVESLGASWGSEDDWPASEGVRAAEPAASSKGDLGGRVAGGNVAEEPHLGGKSPGVPPTRGAAAGGGHAEGPREEQTAADAHAGAAATACWPAGSRDAFHAVLAAPPLLEGAIAGPGVRAVASVQSDDDEPVEPEKGEGEAFDGHHAKEKFAPPKADSVTEKAPAAKSVAEEEEEEREHLEAATKAAICAAQQPAARERDLGSERVSEATGVDATDSDERNVDTEEEDEEEEGKELWAAAAERAETRRAVEGSMQELSRALEKMKGDSRLAIEEVLQREEGEGGAAVAVDARKANEAVCAEAAVPGRAGRLPAEDAGNDFPLPGNAARAVDTGAVEASSVQVPFTDIIAAASEEALTETPASGRTVRSVCPVAPTESHVEDKSAVGKPVTRQEETAFEKEREVNLGGSDISFENIDRAGGELKRRQHQQEETSVAVKDDASSSLTEATAQNLENCARAAAAAIIVGHEVGRGGGEGGPLECEAPAPTSDARAKGDTTSTWDRVPTETDPAGDSSAESEDGAAARDSHRQEQWRQDQRVPAGGETRGYRSGEAPQPDALRATEETAQEAPRGEPTMAHEELEATAVVFQAPRELQSSLESARVAKGQGTANDFMDFEVGSAKQQPQQQPQQQPRQQEPAVAVSVAKFDTPPSAVRVIDSEEEEDDDDDEYENEFYSEETVASAAAPWVQKSLITVEEEELSKPGKVTVIPEPLGGAAGPPPQAAAAAEPKGPVAAPAAATAGPAPAGDEEEPKGFRPAQPPPTWPGFGPPTVIIEEAAEEGGEEREEPAPEVRPRGKPSEAAATAAAAAAEEEKQPEVEKKLPAKAEDGKSRQSLLEKIHLPAVSELVYWRDPRWSGGVLGVLLLLLLSIAHLSVFTIVGYLGLLMLTCTITWRVCRGVLCAVQKREDGHPFRTYLAEDVDVTRERMSRQVEAARVWTTGAATELRRLLLVQDLVDSLKFAGVLWLMTYVGSVFNGLSLLILGVVLLFSVPIAYEKKKTEVDHYLALVQAKVDDATARVKSMIPAALRPNEANSSAK
ncbi:uncharacterized protein LOC133347217 [Lethenteron reissneri]|uniref:uncharacterized protein LOC133347217 n=1 Tax=Lethenteron reissneri TaxID=7753 RepID=UPI002AB786FF|nr:uncharacterized protein LOC133347217 [Lethenteron reissneri]